MAYVRRRKNGNDHEIERRLKALRTDFDGLQKDMRRLVDSVGTAATNAAAAPIEQVEEWAEEGTENVREAIRSQPLAAIAISMGAGAIIGTLLRR